MFVIEVGGEVKAKRLQQQKQHRTQFSLFFFLNLFDFFFK